MNKKTGIPIKKFSCAKTSNFSSHFYLSLANFRELFEYKLESMMDLSYYCILNVDFYGNFRILQIKKSASIFLNCRRRAFFDKVWGP